MKDNFALLVFYMIISSSRCYLAACQMSEVSNDVMVDASTRCPLWEKHNSSLKSDQAVKCERDNNGDYHLSLLPCYCVTQHGNNLSAAVVGLCPYTCNEELLEYISLPAATDASNLTHSVCKNFSRTGQMCGQCESDHAPAVYSYTLKCTKCIEYRMNWLLYITIAFVPQTLAFVIVVFSRLSVTSGLMVGYVTVSQVLATTIELRFVVAEVHSLKPFIFKFLVTLYGIWNLDFFRSLYKPFCMSPNMSVLAAISLDYAVALYPLFLICLSYIILSLGEKYKSVLCCWIPFYQLIYRCYQACDVRNSIIDAFATVVILSYVKILNTSFELLLHVKLFDKDNHFKETVVFYSGDLKYFGKQHLPYAILALMMALIFNVFPLVLLTVYPCQCFHKCLNFIKQGAGVHNILDDFYRSYKHTPRDCRCFAALFLYIRIINLTLLEIALSPVYFSVTSILYLIMAMLIALIQPFKVYSHNIINAILFAVIAVLKAFESTLLFPAQIYQEYYVKTYFVIVVILFHVPPLYGLSLLLYQITPKRLITLFTQKVSTLFRKFRNRHVSFYEESFAHRLSHADEYSHLSNVNS